jgi:CDK inhibitor PHO81
VDRILKVVYDSPMQRAIIFTSFNADICLHLKWKQPNYGVFFATTCGVVEEEGVAAASAIAEEGSPLARTSMPSDPSTADNSIKAAIRFAKTNHLLGLVCHAHPLVQVPVLITAIKEAGLLLATFGPQNLDAGNVRRQVVHRWCFRCASRAPKTLQSAHRTSAFRRG